MTERRRFIVNAGGAMVAAAAAAIVDAPNVIAQPKVQWRMSTAWTPALDHLQGAAQRLAKVVEETSGGRFRIEVYPGGQIMPPFDCFAAASKGTDRGIHGFRVLLDGEGARGRVVHGRPVRHGPRRHGRLVLPGRRPQALGGDVRGLQPRPPSRPRRSRRRWPDGSGRRSNTIGDYKGLKMRIGTGQGGKVYRQGGRHGGPHPGRRDLRRARAGRDRRRRMDRAVRRHEARSPQDRAVLLLPGLARARHHDRVRLQQEGVRSASRRSAADPRSCRRRGAGLWPHGLPREERDRTRTTQDGVPGQGRGAPASRCRCCAISRSCRPRSPGRNPRRLPWPGRCTRPSRSSRRWWVPGTTSPKAPTISSSRA